MECQRILINNYNEYGMRILLVEDHDELSLWLQKALSSSGFAVDLASDGAIADQLLQTERYELVVLDVSLPNEWA